MSKYRSKFEEKVHEALGEGWEYEAVKIPYTKPESTHNYIPDFSIKNSNIVIEAKGRFTAPDRAKLLLVKQQNPKKLIVLVFQNPNIPIRKGSKTSVSDWATKQGFTWVTLKQLEDYKLEENDQTSNNR